MSSLLAVHELSVRSAVPARVLVEAASFTLHAGEILTLLGESGSGKSLLAQAIMGTLPPGLRASGAIRVLDVETPADQPDRRRADWGRKLALLPQEPWSALDPTMKAKDQVAESTNTSATCRLRRPAHARCNSSNTWVWALQPHTIHSCSPAAWRSGLPSLPQRPPARRS